jgi:hypothetical protein
VTVPITVEHLFDRTALTDDPVFVAYLEDRDTRVVAENGVAITASNIQFAFFEPGEIGILTAESAREGDMSTLVDNVCRHFGTTSVTFINVLNRDLDEKLRGFVETRREIGGEEMRCLEGEWQVDLGGVPA